MPLTDRSRLLAAIKDRVTLTKPRLTALVLVTVALGFAMGSRGAVPLGRLSVAVAGAGLVAAGAAVLNQLIERRTDALMTRTCRRPLAAGRVAVSEALVFGGLVSVVGVAVLLFGCGPLPAAFAFLTWATYLGAYTPLKRHTPLAVFVGAVPGALPPVIGWTAAAGSAGVGALVLFAILFFWQVPHFLAIAWLYRDDYARAGFPLFPVLDPDGRSTARKIVFHTLALLAAAATPGAVGLVGPRYLYGAVALGAGLLAFAARLLVLRDLRSARHLFLASIAYVPLLCLLLLGTRR